jgi:hypothetical protein
MRYLPGTAKISLTLGDNKCIIKWWNDGSFAVHPGMKSHTGGAMSLGKGDVYGTSTQQKLNTKSSPEAELVGVVNDVMPQILWTRYFLEAQGYGVKDSIINQGNQSVILLEKNRRTSHGKRTRHINIRYFFVAHRQSGIQRGDDTILSHGRDDCRFLHETSTRNTVPEVQKLRYELLSDN